jgi:hypothetical protein
MTTYDYDALHDYVSLMENRSEKYSGMKKCLTYAGLGIGVLGLGNNLPENTPAIVESLSNIAGYYCIFKGLAEPLTSRPYNAEVASAKKNLVVAPVGPTIDTTYELVE